MGYVQQNNTGYWMNRMRIADCGLRNERQFQQRVTFDFEFAAHALKILRNAHSGIKR